MKEEKSNKKILVTGGSGFIGTNLISEFLSRGYKVISCDLLNHELQGYIRCDVRNYHQIERMFNKFGPYDPYKQYKVYHEAQDK